MRSKIVILALVGLAAGAFGTVAGRILVGSDEPVATATAPRVRAVDTGLRRVPRDACRAVARTVSNSAMNDGELRRFLRKHSACHAVVVDSKGPRSHLPPRIVTLPASTDTAATISAAPQGFSGDDHEDDRFEGDDAFEEEHEEDD